MRTDLRKWLSYLARRVLILSLLGLFASQFAPITALGFEGERDHPTERILVVLKSDQELPAVINAFKSIDVQIIHQFPPDAFIASLSKQSDLATAHITNFRVFTDPIDLAVAKDWSKSAYQAAMIWNTLQHLPADQNEGRHNNAQNTNHFEGGDALEISEVVPARLKRYDPTPSLIEGSQFLIGSVAVGIVLPESTGEVDPSSEDWTDEERSLVVSEIVSSMDWWASLEPSAHLSFVYDNIAGNTMPTAVEPITHPFTDQHYWIRDTMSAMGFDYDGSYFVPIWNYNDYLRQTYQTDWAFTIFVVDSSEDVDNTFLDGRFAYAYLGGPFMVMTYGNENYGPNNMDAVAAHEVGHIFRASDQYSAAQIGCTVTDGYLGVENQNSELGCQSNESSIMRGQVWPFSRHEVDQYARGQVGWQDINSNGILDPIDVGLTVNNITWSEAEQSNILTFDIELEETPFESPHFRDILISKLQSVYYRAGEGPWLTAVAADGAFDSYREQIVFTTDPLPSGTYTIYVRTSDNFGIINEQEITTISVTDPFENIINTEFDSSSTSSTSVSLGETLILSGIANHTTGGSITEAQFRLDGGSWLSAQPLDGIFDSSTEAFNILIDTAALGIGVYSLQVRSVDNQGIAESTPAHFDFSIQQADTENLIYLPLMFNRPLSN